MNDEIGGQKPRARRPARIVTKPVTLYPTIEEPKADPTKPAALDKLKLGDAVKSVAAPQIGGKGFTISFRIDTEQRDTVILAHGGSALGYALHLKDSRVMFSVRTAMGSVTEVRSEPIKGAVKITAALATDGTMTLTVGEQAAVTGKAPGAIPRQPQEDFCLGHDNGQPVAAYTQGKPFEGRITGLAVTVSVK